MSQPSELFHRNRAYLFALMAVLFWSTIAVAFKVSLRTLDPFQIVFGASLVSFLIFVVINVFRLDRTGWRAAYSGRGAKRSALLGLLNPFGYYLVLIHAYDMITAQEAMTLNYLWPIMLAVLAVPLLKQPMGWRSLAALAISFGGIVVIATRGNIGALEITSPAGVALAAGSSVVWALYWIFNLKDERDVSLKLMMNFGFGTLYALIALMLFSTPFGTSLPDWTGAIYLGFFEMGLTFLLWLTALKMTQKTYLVSQLVFLAPPLSLLWIRLVLKEPLLPSTIVGLVLILGGIIIQQQKQKTPQ